MAMLQLIMGIALLSLAGWLYVVARTTPHFIPGLVGIVVAPPGVALIGSGLALRFRWPGWQVLQLAPWLALVATIAWLRSLT